MFISTSTRAEGRLCAFDGGTGIIDARFDILPGQMQRPNLIGERSPEVRNGYQTVSQRLSSSLSSPSRMMQLESQANDHDADAFSHVRIRM